jgi:hypothetical protein
MADQLRSWGEPPYHGQDAVRHTTLMTEASRLEKPYIRFDGPDKFFLAEFGLLDSINALRGFVDTGGLLYEQMQRLDFRRPDAGGARLLRGADTTTRTACRPSSATTSAGSKHPASTCTCTSTPATVSCGVRRADSTISW